MVKDLIKANLKWGVNASKYWSSYAFLVPYEDYIYFTISDALFVGNETDGDDYWSLYNAFQDTYRHKIVAFSNETFNTYWKKAAYQTPEPIFTNTKMENLASFLLNDTMALCSDMVDDLIDKIGFFGCISNPKEPCMASIQFLHTIPRNNIDGATNTAIPR